MRDEARAARRAQHDAAAGHALADVVVGVAFEFQVQAAGVERAEALAGGAVEAQRAAARRSCRGRRARARSRRTGARRCCGRCCGWRNAILAAALVRDRRRRVRCRARAASPSRRRVQRWRAAVAARASRPSPAQQRREVEAALSRGCRLRAGRSRSVRPMSSSSVRTPSCASHSRTSSATKRKKFSTRSGRPVKWFARRRSSCVATPVAQLLRWQMRRYLQPSAIIGAVPKPKLSAPSIAALITSSPVLRPPSVCSDTRVAQVVGEQRLVRFGQAQFPRRAGVADRRQRAGAGAAVVAGDGDQVGVGLDHARRDRADAGVRDQLHRHQRLRIDLLAGRRSAAPGPRSNRCRGAAAARSGRCRAARSAAARSAR